MTPISTSPPCCSRPPGRALEVGSGEGADAIWLARQGWTVTAVDFSTIAIERARVRARAAGVMVHWANADVRDYIPETDAYDLSYVAYLQMEWDNRRTVLPRLINAGVPGGLILIVGRDAADARSDHGGDPRLCYTPEQMKAELPNVRLLLNLNVPRLRGDDESGHRHCDVGSTVLTGNGA